MKFFAIVVLAAVSSVSSFACTGESQIMAKIKTAKLESESSCKVYIDISKVRFYSANGECPMDISELAANGVEVGTNSGVCSLTPGQELNGVVVKDKNNNLFLE